jgi:hypothetical protein
MTYNSKPVRFGMGFVVGATVSGLVAYFMMKARGEDAVEVSSLSIFAEIAVPALVGGAFGGLAALPVLGCPTQLRA